MFDLALLAVIVLAAVLAAAFTFAGEGEEVKIVKDGEIFSYSLSENREIRFKELTVVIKDKKVWIKDSVCPDKVCEHTGRISRPNETVTCLPSKITVYITGKSELMGGTGQS